MKGLPEYLALLLLVVVIWFTVGYGVGKTRNVCEPNTLHTLWPIFADGR